MTTSANPTDEIIELTEIVDEGVNTAADKLHATTLDQELDSLLREVSDKGLATDAISASGPAITSPAASSAVTAKASGSDLDDELEDLFESFKGAPAQDEANSLDQLLGVEQSPAPQSRADDLPGSQVQEQALDLVKESIIELTDIVAGAEPPELFDQIEPPAPETAREVLPSVVGETPAATTLGPENIQRVAEHTVPDTEDVELTEFQVSWDLLSTRLDSFEERMDKFLPLRSEQVLATLPATAQDLPFLEDLQENILSALKGILPTDSVSEDAGLRQDLTALHFRLTNLEAHPRPEPMTITEIVAALPEEPAQIPALNTLKQNLLAMVEARFAALEHDSSTDMPGSALENCHQRLDALEARPEIRSMSREEILTLLPDDPAQIPALATLHQDVQGQLFPLSAAVDDLRARPGADAVLEDLAGLRDRVLRQDEELRALHEELEQKELSLVALRQQIQDLEGAMTRETSRLTVKIKEDVLAAVQNQIPAVAAQVIREEIATLVKELEG